MTDGSSPTFSESGNASSVEPVRSSWGHTSARVIASALNRVSPRVNLHPYAPRWPLNPVQRQRDVRDAYRGGIDLANFIVTRMGRETDLHPDLDGLDILVIGRIWHLGVPMMAQILGGHVTSIDRAPLVWRDIYHDGFYRRLAALCRRHLPDIACDAFDRVIAQKDHAASGVRCETGDFGLDGSDGPDGSSLDGTTFDVIASDSALQHLSDPHAAIMQMSSRLRPGGFGVHRVDFRTTRRDPFGSLCLDEDAFQRAFTKTSGRCGNRVRPTTLVQWCEDAGFDVTLEPIDVIDEAVIARHRPNLAAAFAELPDEDLRIGSATVFLRKRI